MDEERKDAELGTPDIFAPFSEEKPPFSASKKVILAALAMFVLAYIYILSINGCRYFDSFAIFSAGFVAMAEWLLWERKRSRESLFWLACTVMIAVGLLPREREIAVFNAGESILLLHVYAVYWVLCRADLLHGGESSTLLPLDGLFGFIVLPFGNFFLRLRSLIFGVRLLRKDRKKHDPLNVAAAFFAALLGIGLLIWAGQLLSGADTDFAALLEKFKFEIRLSGDWDMFLLRLIGSLPVGAYLFGLLGGSCRAKPEAFRVRGDGVLQELSAIRRVPQAMLAVILAAFTILYLTFFAVQSRYLFGAFTRTLPEGFIVSEYARQGFFELCKVMAVNFALLWLVTRSSVKPVGECRLLKILCAALLAQSMVFAVIAFSKLALYISCFGFTPLRLQSSWLVVVLFFGCVCAADTLFRGRKRFGLWLRFAGLTLAALNLYGLFS